MATIDASEIAQANRFKFCRTKELNKITLFQEYYNLYSASQTFGIWIDLWRILNMK